MGTGREVARGHEAYPSRLEELPHPPASIYLEGPWDPSGPVVAVVGSRDATGDGIDFTEELAGDLASSGVAVISGLARGIDAAAHRGALAVGGRSGAVLGTPLDRTYPRSHGPLQSELARSLGLLSEHPPGAAVTPSTFASRNRILAVMSDAVVIVQGGASSGALLTVAAAHRYGRPVGAVPWDPREPRAAAPLRLIREGATLVRHAGDVLDLLATSDGPGRIASAAPPRRGSEDAIGSRGTTLGGAMTSRPPLGDRESKLLAALRFRAEPLEYAATRAGLSIADASAAGITLELLGLAKREPGGLVRCVRTRGARDKRPSGAIR